MVDYQPIGIDQVTGQSIVATVPDRAVGILYADDNLAGIANPATARANLGITGGFAPVTSTLSLGISGSGATGTQISATNPSSIRVTYATQFTYSLSGNPGSFVIVKTCPTNSATESDWVEAGQTGSDQQSGLAVTIGQTIRNRGQICTDLAAGHYVKAVASGAGTHSETFVSGQKTIYS